VVACGPPFQVVFKLHDSFENSVRVVATPPYELTETGWGEFEIGITLHFKDDTGEKPIELFHPLKLYEDQAGYDRQSTKKPVVTEKYEEAVFCEPYEGFYKRVQADMDCRTFAAPSEILPYYPKHTGEEEIAKINAARRSILQQIQCVQRQL